MYEGPITYETQIYDTFLILFLSSLIAFIIVFFLISLSKLFKKAEKNPLLAFIPFYNVIILLQVASLPSYYLILLFIPLINIYPAIRIALEIARSFRKKKTFAIGLFFLPLIYYPLLAFKDDRYVGINEEKVNSIVLEDLDEKEEEKPVIEESGILITTESKKEEETPNTSFIMEQNDNKPAEIKMPEFKSSKGPQYKECPNCHNKVNQTAPTCFICGHKFEM